MSLAAKNLDAHVAAQRAEPLLGAAREHDPAAVVPADEHPHRHVAQQAEPVLVAGQRSTRQHDEGLEQLGVLQRHAEGRASWKRKRVQQQADQPVVPAQMQPPRQAPLPFEIGLKVLRLHRHRHASS